MILQEYTEVAGIKVFHESTGQEHADYNAVGLDNLFRAENHHFWFLARKEFIFQCMRDFIPSSSKMIEIGAGTGNVARFLIGQGYTNMAVGEMHSNGLKYAQSYGVTECYQFDLLRAPFKEEFDVVCMFDVLEHIQNDEQALARVSQMLVKNGHVVLTVPAHQWLWNRDDAIAGHKRRYTKKELVRKLENAGFDVQVARYFFILIVPFLLLRRLLRSDRGGVVAPVERTQSISMNPLISKVLYVISRLENRLNRCIPNLFGGSLLIIARKR